MTAGELLKNAPPLDILDSAISIRTLQLALLQQQYAPNHPLFSKNPVIVTPTAELAGMNVAGSEYGSDKVTLGDATSVCLCDFEVDDRYKEHFLYRLHRLQCLDPPRLTRPIATGSNKSDKCCPKAWKRLRVRHYPMKKQHK